MERMITVTGVTGKLGGIVLDDLRSRVPADQIVAVARTPEKVDAGVEVRRGDYDDPASLRAAFAGRGRAAARLLAGRHAGRAAAPARQRDHGGRRGGRGPHRLHERHPRQGRPGVPPRPRRHRGPPRRVGRAVHGAAQHLLRGGAGEPGPARGRRGGRAARGRQGRAGQLRHPARPRARRLRRADRGRARGRGARAARPAVDGGRARRDPHRGGGHAGGLPRGGLRVARPRGVRPRPRRRGPLPRAVRGPGEAAGARARPRCATPWPPHSADVRRRPDVRRSDVVESRRYRHRRVVSSRRRGRRASPAAPA